MVVLTNQISPPKSKLHMPVRTEEYVELICDQSLLGFILPVIYNILVIVVCALVGFLTRKLPENFNESWFIFVSVATTLFMWAVFLPSYYNAFYVYLQDALLALCLIMNAYITMGCVFLSKIYAVLFVKETSMKIFNVATLSTSVAPGGAANKVETVTGPAQSTDSSRND